jgi:hypothetical protein
VTHIRKKTKQFDRCVLSSPVDVISTADRRISSVLFHFHSGSAPTRDFTSHNWYIMKHFVAAFDSVLSRIKLFTI